MTRKRILAVILAVMVVIGSLPFSVFAEEIANDEAISSGVTLEDSSGNFPVLFAQDPFNTVKSEVEGGTNYMTSVGVTRESIVQELEAHEDDNYYLGTPYAGGDAQSPNGDTSYNSGTVGMNCGGFISYVLRKAGLDAETTMEIMHRTPVNQYGSGLPYDWLAGASNYKNLVENGNISAYAFRTKQELLSSGLAEKGDIILMCGATPLARTGPTITSVSFGAKPAMTTSCGTAAQNLAPATKSPPLPLRPRAASISSSRSSLCSPKTTK